MAANSAFHAGFLLISPPIRHNSTCIRCIIYIKHKGKVFLEDRMKRIICVLLVTVLIVSMLLSCSIPLRNSGKEKQRIVVQLDQDYWLASVGKMLKEHFPDVEFDFVIIMRQLYSIFLKNCCIGKYPLHACCTRKPVH